jgi:ATP-dependent helicase HrpB
MPAAAARSIPAVDLARLDLPLAPFLPRISALLQQARCLVLSAEPGAGKSTLVPPFLLDQPWLDGKRIVMLEPRRLAAAAVASRIAELLGEPVGGRAGYRVRGASRVGSSTRIEVVTEALLTREIQDDPLLAGTGLVVFDEFHERSIHADLALALAMDVRRARPDLALLVMSATLDTGRVAGLLGGGSPAPVLDCPGRLHPVETRYRPLGADRRRWEEGFAEASARLFDESGGDLLAFVPGAAEIRRAGAALAGRLGDRADVLGLHGSMSLEDQQRIVRPGGAGKRRRVILATSIAETSLTVPGVRAVADSGLSRIARFHPATGLDRLVTEKESLSSADQRRGRAGRLGPGICLRAWSESERLVADSDPEILRSDLAGVVLECALWGVRDPAGLAWLDPPPPPAWGQAVETLRMLGLLEASGPTALGRRAAGLGLAPRLAALAMEGIARGQPALAAACAALLAERDGSGIVDDPDVRLRLEMLRTGAGGREAWRRALLREAERVLRRAGARGAHGSSLFSWTQADEAGVGGLLVHAFPDRIARREPDGSWRFVTGRAARFPSPAGTAAVSRAAADWITAPDTDAGETAGTIRLAAPVDPAEAERALGPVTEEILEVRWDGLVPRGVRCTRAGRLLLSERPCRPQLEAGTASFLDRLSRLGTDILPWDAASRRLLERMRFYASRPEGQGIGDLSGPALAARAGEWLAPHLDFSSGPVLTARRLSAALAGLLASARPPITRRALDAAVPDTLALPLGASRPIDYSSGSPVVEARIQEVYGLSASPRICGQLLAFRLLSPAGRPLQVTADLAGFWKGSYAEVRKQMRGRYPKHDWPEDPSTARPGRGPRRRPAG